MDNGKILKMEISLGVCDLLTTPDTPNPPEDFFLFEGDLCQMLGDGNIYRIEEVLPKDIVGILRTIYYPDGTEQDCRDKKWLKKALWWYRLRKIRRFLIPLLRLCRV